MKRLWRRALSLFPSRWEWRGLRRGLWLAGVSVVLLWCAFPPLSQGWVAWGALAPFFLALRGRTPKMAAWTGYFFGAGFFYSNLFWLNTLSSVNPAAPVGIVAMALILALWPALFGWVVARMGKGGWPPVAFLPLLWTGLEYLRSLSEWGFPWLYLGHTQHYYSGVIQVADVAGVYGISFVMVAVNAALARGITDLRVGGKQRRSAVMALILAGVCCLALGTYGALRLRWPVSPEKEALWIAMIQPGVPQHRKLASYDYRDPERAEKIQENLYAQLERQIRRVRAGCDPVGLPLPDLYVLPESVITYPWFNLSREHLDMATRWADLAGAPIFFGASRFAPPTDVSSRDKRFFSEARSYNSAYIARPGKRVDVQRAYDKRHLVPFGEYGSYLDFIPGFTDLILGIGSFTPGEKTPLYRIRQQTFGALICFESCFSYLFRDYPDADFFVIITNDAWYKKSTGAYRHLVQSIFRAVEYRRPLVRVANTGISCMIDPWGRLTARLHLQEGVPQETVKPLPLNPFMGHTLYARWGDFFAWLCLIAVVVLCLKRRWMHKSNGTNHA